MEELKGGRCRTATERHSGRTEGTRLTKQFQSSQRHPMRENHQLGYGAQHQGVRSKAGPLRPPQLHGILAGVR